MGQIDLLEYVAPYSEEHVRTMYAVTRLAHVPAVIVTADVPLEEHLRSLDGLIAEINDIVQAAAQPVTVILDVRTLDICFSDVVLCLDACRRLTPSTRNPARLRLFIVGTHPMLPVGVKKFRQQLGINAHQFATLDEAVTVCAEGVSI